MVRDRQTETRADGEITKRDVVRDRQTETQADEEITGRDKERHWQ